MDTTRRNQMRLMAGYVMATVSIYRGSWTERPYSVVGEYSLTIEEAANQVCPPKAAAVVLAMLNQDWDKSIEWANATLDISNVHLF